jgi:hypothetical protein
MLKQLKFLSKSKKPMIFHSDLLGIGRDIFQYKDRFIPYLLSNLQTECLFIPTFTFDLNQKTIFDKHTPPKAMGSLSNEIVRAQEKRNYFRIINPIHSYAFTNKKYTPNTKNLNNKSFGKGTIFDFFFLNDFLWTCFGASPNSGFTIFHHCEALTNVSYRQWINLKRKIQIRNKVMNVNFSYFARKENIESNFYDPVKDLKKNKIVKSLKTKNFITYIGSTKEIVEFICDRILKNESYLLQKIKI